jgi:hypothetical protein
MPQSEAKLRLCAHCEYVWWRRKTPDECPKCGFAHYGSIWAIGFWPTIIKWVFKIYKKENKYGR